MSVHFCRTYPKNEGTQYYPREFSDEEKEKYFSSEEMKNFVLSVALRLSIMLYPLKAVY